VKYITHGVIQLVIISTTCVVTWIHDHTKPAMPLRAECRQARVISQT